MKELAIISDVRRIAWQTIYASLGFTANTLNGKALISMSVEEAARLAIRENIHDFNDLVGRACIIDDSGYRAQFVGLFKP